HGSFLPEGWCHVVTVWIPTAALRPTDSDPRAPPRRVHSTVARESRVFPRGPPSTGAGSGASTVSIPAADHDPTTNPVPPTRVVTIVWAGFWLSSRRASRSSRRRAVRSTAGIRTRRRQAGAASGSSAGSPKLRNGDPALDPLAAP